MEILSLAVFQVTAIQQDDEESGMRRSPRIVAKRVRAAVDQVLACIKDPLFLCVHCSLCDVHVYSSLIRRLSPTCRCAHEQM